MKKRSPEEIEKEAMQYQLAMLKNERRNCDQLQSIRKIVGHMNSFNAVVADNKSRLEYDLYRQRLRQAMHDLKIKDEDAWKIADRYVQDNLDVLSIWQKMENKQSMIEEWAKKVEHSKKQELSKEAANHFMMAAYLQYIAVKRGIKTIGISEWAQWAFPWGLPTEDEWQRLWNAQKIPVDMREDTMTDNMLDCPNLFGKSIWEIKDE